MPEDEHSADAPQYGSSVSSLDQLAARLIRRARAIRVLRSVGLVGAYGGAIVAALLLAVAAGIVRIDPWQLLGLYGAAVAVGGIVAGFGFRKSRSRALLDADLAYETEELLSTAYGELRYRPHSPFTKSIAAQAAGAAQSIIPSRVYSSRRIRPLTVPAALFMIAATAIGMGWIAPAASVPVGNERAAQLLEELGSRMAAEAAPQNDSGSREVARELQELGERLSGNGLDEQTRERARELLPRIEEQVDSLARSSLPDATQHSQELAEAEDMIRGLLGRGNENRNELTIATPGSGSGNTSPDESVPGEGSGSGGGNRTPDEAEAEQSSEPGDRAGEARNRRSPDGSGRPRDIPYGAEGGNSAGRRSGDTGSAQLDEGEGGTAGRSGNSGGGPRGADSPSSTGAGERPGGGAAAGAAAGSTSEGSGEELENRLPERAASRLESDVREGEVLRLYVRRLAERAESNLPDANISQEYQTAIESAIGRQQVPARAESLVRDYFVVLGITRQNRQDQPGGSPSDSGASTGAGPTNTE